MLEKSTQEYDQVWRNNLADRGNVLQKHDADIVRTIKRTEAEEELRLEVDELMRQELKNLKAALETDSGKKGKKGKKGGKKGKKSGKKGKKSGKKGGKKGGKKAKGKAKKDKDMTADVPIPVLYKELVDVKVVKRVPNITMDEIVGNYSFLGSHIFAQKREPEPSLADVRRVLTEYCIMPLGSQAVHETQPVLVRSVLMAGPHGTGKRSLALSVANELGANFFDLSPANLIGKYTEKKGLDSVEGLLHKVFKLAKHYQPSVIFIGNASSIFAKKKGDSSDASRFKKELPKFIKTISPGDRIVVLGIDDCPFAADTKDLTSCFQKVLLVPKPNYGTRLMLWDMYLRRFGANPSGEVDPHSLSLISEGYTASDLEYAVKTVLTPMRRKQQAYKPLRSAEFVAPLAKRQPVYKEESAEFAKWYSGLLGKKREAILKGEDVFESPDDGATSAKKGKKKKKK